MVNYEKTVHITTSIPLSLFNLAKEKHFRWNECIILGIRTMNGEKLAPNYKQMQQDLEATKKNEEILQSQLTKLLNDDDEKDIQTNH